MAIFMAVAGLVIAFVLGASDSVPRWLSCVPAGAVAGIFFVSWLSERHAQNGEPGLVGVIGFVATALALVAAWLGWGLRRA
ncbi:MAG TPA: hypothetical protein VIJ15_10035 [Dermatophilaceae bacterium]